MKTTFLTLAVIAASAMSANAFTAADAFVGMPGVTLDLLNTSMRRDMLDYYEQRDSVYKVMNTMEGFSHLNLPVNDNYIQVQITPVTVYTIKLLPTKKGRLVMTLYTVGDSLQAEDSEIRFYDEKLQELKRDKYIKTLSTDDFLDFRNVEGNLKKELSSLVPFPTVKYSVTPEGETLTAELTVDEFLSRESLEKLTPYLKPKRTYHWTGTRWELDKVRD